MNNVHDYCYILLVDMHNIIIEHVRRLTRSDQSFAFLFMWYVVTPIG